MGHVAEGKDAIDAAPDKASVDAAVTTAKLAMDDVEPILSEELRDRIKSDYLEEFGHEFRFNRFYGLFKGAPVFFIAGDNAALKTVVISGVEFSYSYGWTILVWKDGVFYNLENIEPIFEANILTQMNLEQISIIHAEVHVSDVSINEDKMDEILKQFYLSDAKVLWTGTVDEDFEIDRVVVIMKKTSSYPKLELRDFGVDNGESLNYYFLKSSAEYFESNFRQMLVIYLKQHGKDRVVEAIKELEELEVVRRASPSCIYGIQEN